MHYGCPLILALSLIAADCKGMWQYGITAVMHASSERHRRNGGFLSASISEANLSIGYSSDLMGERETTELASVEQVTEAVGEDDSCPA